MQRDIQALGQIIFSLLVHTDLSDVSERAQHLTDLVTDCSFKFKTWEEVQHHCYFEAIEESSSSGGAQGSTEVSEKKFEEEEVKEIAQSIDKVPLNESFTYEEGSDSESEQSPQKKEANSGAKSLEVRESQEVTGDLVENLEKLLETGFAELIRTEHIEETVTEQQPEQKPNQILLQALAAESGTDDFEVLGSQSEELSDELEDYEVICAADLMSIPA